jgi:hypothetical protein
MFQAAIPSKNWNEMFQTTALTTFTFLKMEKASKYCDI